MKWDTGDVSQCGVLQAALFTLQDGGGSKEKGYMGQNVAEERYTVLKTSLGGTLNSITLGELPYVA